MTVGNGELPRISCPHSHLGPIHNDYLLSFFYSTCDLFVLLRCRTISQIRF